MIGCADCEELKTKCDFNVNFMLYLKLYLPSLGPFSTGGLVQKPMLFQNMFDPPAILAALYEIVLVPNAFTFLSAGYCYVTFWF